MSSPLTGQHNADADTDVPALPSAAEAPFNNDAPAYGDPVNGDTLLTKSDEDIAKRLRTIFADLTKTLGRRLAESANTP